MRHVRSIVRATASHCVRQAAFARALAIAVTLFVSLAVVARTAGAQRVAGTVTDSEGRAVRAADVILGTELRTRTDSTGAFEISTGVKGPQRLRVRFIGFRPFEMTVDAARANATSLRVTLVRMPQMLAAVRITDLNACPRNTLQGFECRRSTGRGIFRDAGEIRSLRPSAWADMFDGIPTLRREAVMTPDGLDWHVRSAPNTCLVQVFNGEDPRYDGHVRKVPITSLSTRDVVAIEYYEKYSQVPDSLRRYAWPNSNDTDVSASASAEPTRLPAGTGCGMIVYWLREAPTPVRQRRGAFGEPTVIRRP